MSFLSFAPSLVKGFKHLYWAVYSQLLIPWWVIPSGRPFVSIEEGEGGGDDNDDDDEEGE